MFFIDRLYKNDFLSIVKAKLQGNVPQVPIASLPAKKL
jgi:hypothetical protein